MIVCKWKTFVELVFSCPSQPSSNWSADPCRTEVCSVESRWFLLHYSGLRNTAPLVGFGYVGEEEEAAGGEALLAVKTAKKGRSHAIASGFLGEQWSSARMAHQLHKEQQPCKIQKGRSYLERRGPLFQAKDFFSIFARVFSWRAVYKAVFEEKLDYWGRWAGFIMTLSIPVIRSQFGAVTAVSSLTQWSWQLVLLGPYVKAHGRARIRYKDQESQVQWANLEHITRTYGTWGQRPGLQFGSPEVFSRRQGPEAEQQGNQDIRSKWRDNQKPGALCYP